jgi:hypothetical protein
MFINMTAWQRPNTNPLETQSIKDLEFLIETFTDHNWDYQELSNRTFSWEFIKRHLYCDWNWNILRCKFTIDNKINDLEEMIKTVEYSWKWDELSNVKFSFEFIKYFQDKPWDWTRLISNSNIDYNYIIDNCPLDIGTILDHLLIQHLPFICNFESFIIDNPQRESLLNSISPPILYKNLTGNIIYCIPYPWDWNAISKHKCMSKEVIQKMHDKSSNPLGKPWNIDLLSKNLLRGKEYEYNKLASLNCNLNILTRLPKYFKMEMTNTIYYNFYELFYIYK